VKKKERDKEREKQKPRKRKRFGERVIENGRGPIVCAVVS
jgi:hypothetical protein